jgi:S1-C subfamily serine protease
MKAVAIGVALLFSASASYAATPDPKESLGKPLPALAAPGGAKPSGAKAPLRAKVDRQSTAFGRTLRRLRPDGRGATRGVKESEVYQQASPSVVLVVTEDGLGSGALVSADGQIVTNLHVVGDADEVGVVFKPKVEGAEISEADVVVAKVVRRDGVADLALLQVAKVPDGVKPLAVGSAAAVQVGADVHAIGHPTGEAWTYTRGIVSQIRRDYEWTAEDRLQHKATVIQTQTPINPGNSGGPLLDDALEIIGINSFKTDGEGLNFAVSADDVKAFLARTADRAAAAAAAEEEDCEGEVLSEEASKDPPGKQYLMDLDCDGRGDSLAVEPDDPKAASYILVTNGDVSKVAAIIYDDDRDGHPDYAEYDTDGDNKPDLFGEYRNGEDEPYRYERLEVEAKPPKRR